MEIYAFIVCISPKIQVQMFIKNTSLVIEEGEVIFIFILKSIIRGKPN